MPNVYKTREFPPDSELERMAKQCPMLAHCPDRPFSFCLKGWLHRSEDNGYYFRKITYKHCYECMNGVEYDTEEE